MNVSRRPGLSVLLYLMLVLLFAPMIALGAVWAWVTLSGLFRAPDIDDLRGVGMMWMTILLAGAAICVLSELLLVPYVLGRAGMRRRWLALPLSLAAGLFAGAAGFAFLGGNAGSLPATLGDPVLFVHGSPNWAAIAPLSSAAVFAVAAAFTAWLLQPRKGDFG